MSPRSITDKSEVITASIDARADHLASLMAEYQIGSVVITKNQKPVGMVTDRDLTLKVVKPGREASDVKASQIMNDHLITVQTDSTTVQIIRKMQKAKVRRMPVVDGDEIVDIITLDDLLLLLAGQQARLAQVIEKDSPQLFISDTD